MYFQCFSSSVLVPIHFQILRCLVHSKIHSYISITFFIDSSESHFTYAHMFEKQNKTNVKISFLTNYVLLAFNQFFLPSVHYVVLELHLISLVSGHLITFCSLCHLVFTHEMLLKWVWQRPAVNFQG